MRAWVFLLPQLSLGAEQICYSVSVDKQKQSSEPINLRGMAPPLRPAPRPTVLQPMVPEPPRPQADPADFLAEPIVKVQGGSITGKIELGVFILLLLVSFVFGLQNLQSVNVKFMTYGSTFPLGVAMLIAATVGGVLVALMWAYWAIKKKIRDGKD